ncbi:hypothetical protein I4U23_031150 [Adineta vaga]|nr:hypothetical protein I4U23_031150 [Adineta vaga]
MLIMATISHRQMKRHSIDHSFTFPIAKNIKRLRDYSSKHDWTLECKRKLKKGYHRKGEEEEEQQHQEYHCYVYLKFFPSTLKCSIDVIVKSTEITSNDYDDQEAILIGKTRIAKPIKSGVIRVRLVSSLFSADTDVHEDISLIKLETITSQSFYHHFDKQFALVLKNNRIGPGVIGKLFVESLDPLNGSYTNNPPIFELNLNLASEHEIFFTSSNQKIQQNSTLPCGCILTSDPSRLTISDECNLILNDMKIVHRVAEPLRCLWKSIGRELSPSIQENELDDINQRYFLTEGNHECTYQLLRLWYMRRPYEANIRYLLTRFKLPFNLIENIHNDVVRIFLSASN